MKQIQRNALRVAQRKKSTKKNNAKHQSCLYVGNNCCYQNLVIGESKSGKTAVQHVLAGMGFPAQYVATVFDNVGKQYYNYKK